MDVLRHEARRELPWGLLYVDDLIKYREEWRESLLIKGLTVIAGKTKVMICG